MTCERCHRPTCPAIRYGRGHAWTAARYKDYLDCERAKSAGLESQLAAAREAASEERARTRLVEESLRAQLSQAHEYKHEIGADLDTTRKHLAAAREQVADLKAEAATLRVDRVRVEDILLDARKELAAARARLSTAANEWQAGYDGEPTPLGDPNEWRVRGAMLRQCEAFVEQAEKERDAARAEASAEAANGAALRTALQHVLTCMEYAGTPLDRPLIRIDTIEAALALPASESVARVQALVEAARKVVEESGPAERWPVGHSFRALCRASDAFAGHANKGGSNE